MCLTSNKRLQHMDLMVLTDLHHLHQLNKLNSVFSSFNINVSDYGPKVKTCSGQSKVKDKESLLV